MVEIVVRDYGFGIPPEEAPLLFNRFVRLPRDLASKVVGSGLGLYLCRTLVEAMGGSIWVESTGVPGEGSAFHVVLPAAPEDRVDVARPLLAGDDGHGIYQRAAGGPTVQRADDLSLNGERSQQGVIAPVPGGLTSVPTSSAPPGNPVFPRLGPLPSAGDRELTAVPAHNEEGSR